MPFTDHGEEKLPRKVTCQASIMRKWLPQSGSTPALSTSAVARWHQQKPALGRATPPGLLLQLQPRCSKTQHLVIPLSILDVPLHAAVLTQRNSGHYELGHLHTVCLDEDEIMRKQ